MEALSPPVRATPSSLASSSTKAEALSTATAVVPTRLREPAFLQYGVGVTAIRTLEQVFANLLQSLKTAPDSLQWKAPLDEQAQQYLVALYLHLFAQQYVHFRRDVPSPQPDLLRNVWRFHRRQTDQWYRALAESTAGWMERQMANADAGTLSLLSGYVANLAIPFVGGGDSSMHNVTKITGLETTIVQLRGRLGDTTGMTTGNALTPEEIINQAVRRAEQLQQQRDEAIAEALLPPEWLLAIEALAPETRQETKTIEKLQKRVEDAAEKLAFANADLAAQKKLVAATEQKYADAGGQTLTNMATKVETLNRLVEDLTKEKAKLEVQKATFVNVTKEQQNDVNRLTRENRLLTQSDVGQLRTQLDDKVRAFAALGEEKQSIDKILLEKARKIAELTADRDQAMHQLEILNTLCSGADAGSLDFLRAQVEMLRASLRDLGTQLAGARAGLSDAGNADDVASLRRAFAQTSQTLTECQGALERCQKADRTQAAEDLLVRDALADALGQIRVLKDLLETANEAMEVDVDAVASDKQEQAAATDAIRRQLTDCQAALVAEKLAGRNQGTTIETMQTQLVECQAALAAEKLAGRNQGTTIETMKTQLDTQQTKIDTADRVQEEFYAFKNELRANVLLPPDALVVSLDRTGAELVALQKVVGDLRAELKLCKEKLEKESQSDTDAQEALRAMEIKLDAYKKKLKECRKKQKELLAEALLVPDELVVAAESFERAKEELRKCREGAATKMEALQTALDTSGENLATARVGLGAAKANEDALKQKLHKAIAEELLPGVSFLQLVITIEDKEKECVQLMQESAAASKLHNEQLWAATALLLPNEEFMAATKELEQLREQLMKL